MSKPDKIKIGLLGLGTVGSGVYKLIEKQKEEFCKKAGADVEIVKILVHNMEKKREGVDPSLLTDNWRDIIDNDEIRLVIEVMGGIEPARTMILDALNAGKNVVSANKDLIAEHGKELLDAAEEHGVDFLFEAAVAGGIPIIRPLNSCLTADEIEEITGIVNGTTNYMMTEMSEKGADFDEVLKDAQAKGYAEKDPTADIEGYDACRKIAILTSLVCGQQVDFEDIHTEGITHISATDIKYAKAMGRVIKLLATSKKTDGGYVAMVAPFLLPKEHPLYNVNGVFNAIFVRGNVLGDAMFYGSGAGKLPTASAVVADVVEMAKNLDKNIPVEWSSKKLELVDYRSAENRFFVRVSGTDKTFVEKVFGNVEYIDAQGVTGELGFVTEVMTEEALENKKAAYGEVLNVIRVA